MTYVYSGESGFLILEFDVNCGIFLTRLWNFFLIVNTFFENVGYVGANTTYALRVFLYSFLSIFSLVKPNTCYVPHSWKLCRVEWFITLTLISVKSNEWRLKLPLLSEMLSKIMCFGFFLSSFVNCLTAIMWEPKLWVTIPQRQEYLHWDTWLLILMFYSRVSWKYVNQYLSKSYWTKWNKSILKKI